jgi:hypothetical protein
MNRYAFHFSTVLIISMINTLVLAQNVGIGTETPYKRFSVNGTILLDHNNTNTGGIDSAALLFGTAGGVGISSKKGGPGNVNNLSFYTNNQIRMMIGASGKVGIGGENTSGFLFRVFGTSQFTDNIFVDGVMVAEHANLSGELLTGGNIHAGGDLSVADDGIIGNNFRVNGRVGINGPTNGSFGLFVNNSNSYFQGNISTLGTGSFTGSISTLGNLTVANTITVNNDGIIENNFRVNGRVGINGPTNGSYGLMVNNSNSYFQGNVTATGTINAAGNLTVKGNGHVRSNGPSNLRVGFMSRNVDMSINNGANAAVLVDLSDFEGGNNDMRVFVSQIASDPGGTVLWPEVNVMVSSVNSVNNTCLIWLYNNSGVSGTLKGTIYLTVIAKE